MCRRDHESSIPANDSSAPTNTNSEASSDSTLRNRGTTSSTTTTTRTTTTILKKAVDGLQQVKFRRRGVITGLDSVVFGTLSAAESIQIMGVKPPQYLWYMVSGSACDVIQLSIDCLLHFWLGLTDPSLCWSLGLFISVFFRHTSHRYLVFGNYVGGYRNSLLRMYAGYSVILVLSTLFNFFMTRYANLPHYIAWVLTLLFSGITNYFILKKLWSFGGNKAATSPAVSTGNNNNDDQQQQQQMLLSSTSSTDIENLNSISST